jgi:hypothetical protein
MSLERAGIRGKRCVATVGRHYPVEAMTFRCEAPVISDRDPTKGLYVSQEGYTHSTIRPTSSASTNQFLSAPNSSTVKGRGVAGSVDVDVAWNSTFSIRLSSKAI